MLESVPAGPRFALTLLANVPRVEALSLPGHGMPTVAQRFARSLFAVGYLASVYAGTFHIHEHSHDCARHVDGAWQVQPFSLESHHHCGHHCSTDHRRHFGCNDDRPLDHGSGKQRGTHHDDCSICRSVGQLPLPAAHVGLQPAGTLVGIVGNHFPRTIRVVPLRAQHSRAPPAMS